MSGAASSPDQKTSSDALCARLILRRPGGYTLHVDLSVPPGVTVLVGPSGAGKSTTLDLLAGHATADQGEITLGPRTLFRQQPGAPPVSVLPQARRIGYVMQTPSLFPHLSVAANISFGLFALAQEERSARIHALATRLELTALLGRAPQTLSGGERQRVALARALAPQPQALLLDEPLSAVDLAQRAPLLQTLRSALTTLAIPVLYVTHSAEEQAFFAQSDCPVLHVRARPDGSVELA